MIQTGDPKGTGGTGYAFKDEFTDLKFDKAGVLAMANSGATNSSQFSLPTKTPLAKRKTHYFWACNRRNGYQKYRQDVITK
jgi:cyclophilin family peptidyl-prolyl cis-trans isomerase